MTWSGGLTPIFRASLLPAVTLALVLGAGSRSLGLTLQSSELWTSVAVAMAAVYLLSRVQLRAQPMAWATWPTCVGALLMTGGAVVQSWLTISVGWSLLTYASVRRFLDEPAVSQVRPWWPVLLMVVPWVWADGWWLGYSIRTTGSVAAEWLLGLAFDDVSRSGTTVHVAGVSLSVEAACAGLNTLQAFLLVGLAGAALSFGRFWTTCAAIPVAFAMAWIANTARVVVLGAIAATVGPDWATGSTHDFLGWVTLGAAALLFANLLPERCLNREH